MSAASVAVVVTSGERHEGKASMVLFAGKTVWSMPEHFVCIPLCKKAPYKYSSFLFLSFPFPYLPFGHNTPTSPPYTSATLQRNRHSCR